MLLRPPWIRAVLETAAGLLYPPMCVGCEVALEPGQYLCEACDRAVPRIEEPCCMLCSQSSAGAVVTGQFVCLQCRERPPRFDCAVSARQHEGLARDLIARFKYHGEHYLCRPLAAWMATALREDARLRDWATEGEGAALVPVPLHARRRRERGFNQAESLCAALARESGLQVWHALRRVRYTRTQTELTRQQRQQNLYAAITVDARFEERIAGARVLLVDDVFTTGATVNECARTLWQAGAAGVRVLTVVRRL